MSDWLNLLRNQSLPLVGLPRTNPTTEYAPPTVFDQEVVDIIHRLDARMFDEFRYKKRTDVPFEIK